jgi:hypothetical protein
MAIHFCENIEYSDLCPSKDLMSVKQKLEGTIFENMWNFLRNMQLFQIDFPHFQNCLQSTASL